MALCSLLTKMPALGLGLRSRGAVHALSPAAARRPMSHGGPGEQIISEGTPTTIYYEEIKALEADCKRLHEKINRDMDAFSEILRQVHVVPEIRWCSQKRALMSDAEYYTRLSKQLKMVDAALVLGVSAAVYMTIT